MKKKLKITISNNKWQKKKRIPVNKLDKAENPFYHENMNE
ncbi:hypothetical protein BSBH6_02359 [Bacillus subtilis]|nr:hypothetical protein BSBH6_02359 [Bacillus subtilis]RPK24920.1 hypothetical protein BH5_01750 [Bacillus subtilis]